MGRGQGPHLHEQDFGRTTTLVSAHTRGFGRTSVVSRTLRTSAQRHRRRVGVAAATRVWQRRFLSGEPQSPPAAAFNSPSGAGWTPARSHGKFLRIAQGHSPWASSEGGVEDEECRAL